MSKCEPAITTQGLCNKLTSRERTAPAPCAMEWLFGDQANAALASCRVAYAVPSWDDGWD